MLKEMFLYLVTPCQPRFRKLGYLTELIAIEAKYVRVKKHWQPHLDQSRQAITEASERVAQHRKVIVLGSGMLLDIPLEILSARFNEVVLVDVAHLNRVRRQTRQFSNVKLAEADITDMTDAILAYQMGDALPTSTLNIPGYDEHTDLVISLNLFSQLPVTPRIWLDRKFNIEHETFYRWSAHISEQHLSALTQLDCSVLVMGDMSHTCLQHEVEINRDDFMVDLHLPLPDRSWSWPVDPLGELPDKLVIDAQVGAWFDWQKKDYPQTE